MQIFQQAGDYGRLETEMRDLIERNPANLAFRRALIDFYLSKGRDLDAERELRSAVAADAANIVPFMELIRFLNTKRGADAAERELQARISAGGNVFAYRLALAEFEAARGRQEQAIKSIRDIIQTTSAPVERKQAQLTLARSR